MTGHHIGSFVKIIQYAHKFSFFCCVFKAFIPVNYGIGLNINLFYYNLPFVPPRWYER